jgi:signal transduction histidine kinase
MIRPEFLCEISIGSTVNYGENISQILNLQNIRYYSIPNPPMLFFVLTCLLLAIVIRSIYAKYVQAIRDNAELELHLHSLNILRENWCENIIKDAVIEERLRLADRLHDQTLGNLSSVH